MAENISDHEEEDYDDYEENTDEDESFKDGIFNKQSKEKKRQGRRRQWPEPLVDDLVDIIVESEKFRDKLLLTNVKNVKNSQYYAQVIEEIKARCNERDEEFSFDIKQTRQKFKRCVNICRNAVMKVKTASGIKRFQEDKHLGNWFAKLLPYISSMDNCQPQQAIEPGQFHDKSPASVRDGEVDDDSEKSEVEDQGSRDSAETSCSSKSSKSSSKKRKSYVPTPTMRKKSLKTEAILGEIKDTVESLKSLSSENSSKEILDFLREESRRQAERDNAFFQVLTNFLQPNPNPPMYQLYNCTNQPVAGSNFRFGMTMQPESSSISHPQESQISFTSQVMDPNYP